MVAAKGLLGLSQLPALAESWAWLRHSLAALCSLPAAFPCSKFLQGDTFPVTHSSLIPEPSAQLLIPRASAMPSSSSPFPTHFPALAGLNHLGKASLLPHCWQGFPWGSPGQAPGLTLFCDPGEDHSCSKNVSTEVRPLGRKPPLHLLSSLQCSVAPGSHPKCSSCPLPVLQSGWHHC